MNKDQVKGSTKDAVGKVQEKIGQAVGSDSQQIKAWKSRSKARSRRPTVT